MEVSGSTPVLGRLVSISCFRFFEWTVRARVGQADPRRVAAATRIQAGFRGHRQRHQLRASLSNLTRLQARVRERQTRRKVAAAKQMVHEIERQERDSRSRHQRLLAYRRELEMLDRLPPSALARFAECVQAVGGRGAEPSWGS
jgi:hypothetical protein